MIFIGISMPEESHFVLPAATFAESSGTFINNEGRAQRFYRSYIPHEDIQDSWKWISQILCKRDKFATEQWHNLDDILNEISSKIDVLRLATEAAKPADFKMIHQKIPRQTHRFSGRTAIYANKNIHEQPPSEDEDSAMSFSMEGCNKQPPPSLIAHYWSPGWNSVQAINKYQEDIGTSVRGGSAGKRLIEPSEAQNKEYFDEIPHPFKMKDGMLFIVPSYHIFGSEELSSQSTSIQELTTAAYIAINPGQSNRLDINDDGTIEVAFSDVSYYLPVKLSPSVPKGLALVPMGVESVQWNGVPVWKRLMKEST